MGGWYLQPDCNMPSGESFVRQILLGKAYFKKHFGVEPKTAINFDPFGHTRGLVQILAKSGYDSYLFGRPQRHQMKLGGEPSKIDVRNVNKLIEETKDKNIRHSTPEAYFKDLKDGLPGNYCGFSWQGKHLWHNRGQDSSQQNNIP